MLKMKKNIADNIPIEDTTPAITHSAKLLVITDGIGASLGILPPEIIQQIQLEYTKVVTLTHLATQKFHLEESYYYHLQDHRSILV